MTNRFEETFRKGQNQAAEETAARSETSKLHFKRLNELFELLNSCRHLLEKANFTAQILHWDIVLSGPYSSHEPDRRNGFMVINVHDGAYIWSGHDGTGKPIQHRTTSADEACETILFEMASGRLWMRHNSDWQDYFG
jgi:hypothetical protein